MLTLLLAQADPGALVAGIDADPEPLDRARAKAAATGTTVELVGGRSSALPLPDGSFDRVVSSLLFHHLSLDGKRATLAEARRVLRLGGELHIATFLLARADGGTTDEGSELHTNFTRPEKHDQAATRRSIER